MKIKIAIVNAFVDGETGGNPAGVVLNADELTNQQKLEIAKKVGLSETAFVSKSTIADFKLDFFTPQKQIAHCGHATIATFSYLSQQGLIQNPDSSKETIDGVRKVTIKADFAYMEQLAPKYLSADEDVNFFARALGISSEATISKPMIVNTGNSFLLLGVKNIEQLNRINPDYQAIEAISEKYDLIGFYIFTLETNLVGRDASARMFAPRYGIKEESATGMAAGPLACYLHDYLNVDKPQIKIEQGYSMRPSSPSCITVSLEKDQQSIQSLVAGGRGVPSSFVEIDF